jgi:hypothetical protein
VHIPYSRELLERVIPQTTDIADALRALQPAALAS